jgi:hypothetical protein
MNNSGKTKKRLLFRLYGEEIRLGQKQGSGCYFAIRRGIGLLFENKKVTFYFNEGNTIKEKNRKNRYCIFRVK